MSIGKGHTKVAALLAAALLLTAVFPVQAAAGDENKHRSFTVGQYAFSKLEKAHELLSDEKFTEAREVLNKMSEHRGLNEHERAVMHQTYAYIESSQQHYRAAAERFEKALALDALPEGARLNTLYNLAQIYLADENFDEAAAKLEEWFTQATNPGPEAYYLLAVAYIQAGRHDAAYTPASTAVTQAKTLKQSWLQLLLALELERKDYGKALKLLETAVQKWPNKAYWMQLSAVYAELGREQDSLAAMQVAYTQGYLTSDSELRNLARMYLYHDLPFQAATLLEKAFDQGRITPEPSAYELLADAWLNARDYDKALAPLRKAASMSDDGKLYLKLARLLIEREDWKTAAEALMQALAKPQLKERGKALLLLGIARYSNNDWQGSQQAFEKASRFDAQRQEARKWLEHLRRKQGQDGH